MKLFAIDIALGLAMPQACAKFNLDAGDFALPAALPPHGPMTFILKPVTLAAAAPSADSGSIARRLGAACLAVGLLLGFAANAAADTIVTKTFSYFPVHGRTAEELDQGLSSGGPLMKSTGMRHPGATRIKFGGTVSYVVHDGRCRIGKARVTLSTKIILPRWTNRKRAKQDLAIVWDTLSSDIKRHEERHAEIARNHARALERTFLALRPQADCALLQEKVTLASQEAIAAHDKDQARFDRTEAANFDKRMLRLLQYRLNAMKAAR